jgi:hypothetical protein
MLMSLPVAMSQAPTETPAAAAAAQKPRAVSAHHCDTIYPAGFGVTRRGSASKGKGIAAACAIEKERERGTSINVATRRLGAPPQNSKQKRETSEIHRALFAGATRTRYASLFFASNSLA